MLSIMCCSAGCRRFGVAIGAAVEKLQSRLMRHKSAWAQALQTRPAPRRSVAPRRSGCASLTPFQYQSCECRFSVIVSVIVSTIVSTIILAVVLAVSSTIVLALHFALFCDRDSVSFSSSTSSVDPS